MKRLNPNQRVAHLARAIADAVRRRDRVFGLHEAQLELAGALADAALEAGVDRVHLRHHTHVALTVALGADDADRRLVDQIWIGAKFSGDANRLRRTAWVMINKDGVACHDAPLSQQ